MPTTLCQLLCPQHCANTTVPTTVPTTLCQLLCQQHCANYCAHNTVPTTVPTTLCHQHCANYCANNTVPATVPRHLHPDLAKSIVHVVSRSTCVRIWYGIMKVEAAAWLQGSSYVCDQCPGEYEHVQNEVHTLLFCQDHPSGLRSEERLTPFCLHLHFGTSWQPDRIRCIRQQSTYS